MDLSLRTEDAGFAATQMKLRLRLASSPSSNPIWSSSKMVHQCYKYEFIMRTREPGSDIKRGPAGGPSRGARWWSANLDRVFGVRRLAPPRLFFSGSFPSAIEDGG